MLVVEVNPEGIDVALLCAGLGVDYRSFMGRYTWDQRSDAWAIVKCGLEAMREVVPGTTALMVQDPARFEFLPEAIPPGVDARIEPWGLSVRVCRETRDLFEKTWENGPILGGGPLPRLLQDAKSLGVMILTPPPPPLDLRSNIMAEPKVRVSEPKIPPRSTARRLGGR